jgi:HEPN domain-containing protein
MPRGKTVAVARREAHIYRRKAEQFLEEAHEAVAAERYDAGLLNAIHAAISAADAVTVVLAGRRSADPDHQRAADLLEEMGASTPASKERVRQLRALLSRKNAVEYESRRATAREARDSVERATRLFKWAAETVDRARV